MHVIQEKWPEILNMVRTEHDLSPIAFTTWLEPLQVYKVEGNTVTSRLWKPQEKIMKFL